MTRKAAKNFGLALIIACLTSCGGVGLTTTTSPDAKIQPKKLFVIVNMPIDWPADEKLFEHTFSEKLRACGTQTNFFYDPWTTPKLSLDDDKLVTQEKLIAKEHSFAPDFVLDIKLTSFTVSGNGSGNVYYNLSLSNKLTAQGTPPWIGSASLPFGNFAFNNGEKLAGAIFDDWKKKGLLLNCPPAKG